MLLQINLEAKILIKFIFTQKSDKINNQLSLIQYGNK
jgi:hypothetical protein